MAYYKSRLIYYYRRIIIIIVVRAIQTLDSGPAERLARENGNKTPLRSSVRVGKYYYHNIMLSYYKRS